MSDRWFRKDTELASEEAYRLLIAFLISNCWSGILKTVKRVLSSFHRFM